MKKMKNLARTGFVVMAAALLTLQISAGPAAADPPDLTLTGPNVISYEEGYPKYVLDQARRLIRQGARLPEGGCRFTSTETRQQGGPAITEIELAFDPDTCRLLVEIGVLTTPRSLTPTAGEAVDTSAIPTAFETSTVLQTPGFGTGPVPGAIYSANAFRAYLDQWYDEPARWIPGPISYDFIPPVNEQLNFVEWTPGGGCTVAPGTTGWVGYWQRWLTPPGWYRVSHAWNHSPDPIPCDQAIFSESWTHFQNRAFCAWVVENVPGLGPILPPIVGDAVLTDTYYVPNHIHGNSDGSYTITMVKDKTGLCSFLLRGGQTDSYY